MLLSSLSSDDNAIDGGWWQLQFVAIEYGASERSWKITTYLFGVRLFHTQKR